MQLHAGHDPTIVDKLSSRPDGWRRVEWSGGAFETAHRPMTRMVEGRIRSSNHLIMATLQGGADRCEIATDAGHRYDGPDHPATISFLPANCERKLKLHNVAWRWAAIALDPKLMSVETAAALGRLGPLSGLEDGFVWTMLAECDRLDSLDGGLDGTYCDVMSHALTAYLAKRYGRAVDRTASAIRLPAWRLRRVTEFVDANIEGRIGISDLAALAELSEGHFQRAFRATTGQTPLTFIQTRRVGIAKQLLAKHRLSIAQIALQTGFVSPTHFARVFRAIAGRSPSEYRRAFQTGI